jgi:hypothetical protein
MHVSPRLKVEPLAAAPFSDRSRSSDRHGAAADVKAVRAELQALDAVAVRKVGEADGAHAERGVVVGPHELGARRRRRALAAEARVLEAAHELRVREALRGDEVDDGQLAQALQRQVDGDLRGRSVGVL